MTDRVTAERRAKLIERFTGPGYVMGDIKCQEVADALADLADKDARIAEQDDGIAYLAKVRDQQSELIELLRKRLSELEAENARLREALEPFAKEEGTWAASVADSYRPGILEPNQRTAHAKAEFCIGDLRRAAKEIGVKTNA
jgi:chlorite dismutase